MSLRASQLLYLFGTLNAGEFKQRRPRTNGFLEKPMLTRQTLVRFCCILSVLLFAAIHGEAQAVPFDHVTSVSPLADGMEVHDGTETIRITALRDDVIRIRASRTTALPEDASWAVLPAAREASVDVIPDNNSQSVGFHTKKLRVTMKRDTGLLTLQDDHGNVLQQETAPLTFEGHGFHFADAMPLDEHYFGLGDKTGAFDHRNEVFRMWNTDAYSWQESTDPLYKSVPFYLTYRAGVSLGVLIDNTWPCSFDFGKTRGNTFQYRAEEGPANIYWVYGPSAKHVLASYAWLTGPTPLPPLWALGFQQSRYSYMTQARVLQIAARLRTDKIPADAIYLDIDYQYKNRPFTINTTTFPDMAAVVAKLHQEQFHVVAITDPHIAYLPSKDAGQSYAPFVSGVAGNHFVKNPDGSLYVGTVWPGPSVFPDFTQQDTRTWWGTLYRHFDKIGIDGFWNDMDEPSVFNAIGTMPDDVVFPIDEPGFVKRAATQREVHNIYGMENSRATYDGQLALRPNVRPFVLTRATYAGGQRYAATWTGDNSATWNHLRLTTSMLKNLGLSGFSLAGADVGGYAGTPSAELLTKWIEIAAFQPLYRDHAEKGTGPHEPWANGPAQENIRRQFIDARYRLLPYLYTVMERNTRTGLPLLRPVFLEFPDAAPDCHPIDLDPQAAGEFMVGPDLLVAAAPFPDKTDGYNAELPSHGWYDYWTGKRVDEGRTDVPAAGLQPESATSTELTSVLIHPDLAKLPVFVRPGAIVPVEPLVQSTEQKPDGPLLLRVFPGPGCHGELYLDDGTSFDYKRGNFLRMSFYCEATADHELKIHIGKHVGPYPAWWSEIAVEVNGLPKSPAIVRVDGRPAKFANGDHSITVIADDKGQGIEVDIPGAF
jgi:alpha-glucosidase